MTIHRFKLVNLTNGMAECSRGDWRIYTVRAPKKSFLYRSFMAYHFKQGKSFIDPRSGQLVSGHFKNPGGRHIHTAKWRRMVRALKRKGGAYSPYAVATARLGASRLNPACEYCHLLGARYQRAQSAKERRHFLARLKIHRRVAHKNPPSPRRVKIARIAFKMAFRLYKQFKHVGVPGFLIDRIPAEIRPYVVETLKANNVKIIRK